MALLSVAGLLVAIVPFERWRNSLGALDRAEHKRRSVDARRLAGYVNRAAALLPFHTKCLPRAMALSWLLRRQGIGHTVVIAARPAGRREAPDGLHAWVEVGGVTIIGELPGPWIETLRLGPKRA